MNSPSNLLKGSSLFLIRLYQQTVSEILPSRCRFTPSCSQYALEALSQHGFLEGLKLAYQRIKRCQYPNRGFDPVPQFLNPALPITSSDEQNNKHQITRQDAQPIKGQVKGNYNTVFRLILAYPQGREILTQEGFEQSLKSRSVESQKTEIKNAPNLVK